MSYIRNNEFVWKKIGGESFILDVANEKSHSLNESATWIWCFLDVEKEFDDIVTEFLVKFDAPVEIATKDIQNILMDLNNLNLVIKQ